MTKRTFITGASSGLGKATAKLFAKHGGSVIATMRKPENESELDKFKWEAIKNEKPTMYKKI